MALTNEIRTEILRAICERIEGFWGPSGTVAKTFRQVTRGQWSPAGEPKPRCVVTDAGQRLAEAYPDVSGGTEPAQMLSLQVQVVLDLVDNWDREDGGAEWTDLVANIIADLCGRWAPSDLGVVNVDYAGDDPWTALLQSGASHQVWIIDFDVTYCLAIAAVG